MKVRRPLRHVLGARGHGYAAAAVGPLLAALLLYALLLPPGAGPACLRAPASSAAARPLVAVSLLLSEASSLTALTSLLASDAATLADLDVIAFSNAPAGAATVALRAGGAGAGAGAPPRFGRVVVLTAEDVVWDEAAGLVDPRSGCPPLSGPDSSTPGNLGIIVPRIWVMQEALRGRPSGGGGARPYDWLLEAHDDLVFPRVWAAPLLELGGSDPDAGILQPWLYRDLNYSTRSVPPSPAELDALLAPLYRDEVLGSYARAVHPWLLRMDMVREAGYYDPRLAPSGAEDLDYFYFVCALSRWRCLTTGASIVFHGGGVTWAEHLRSTTPCAKPVDTLPGLAGAIAAGRAGDTAYLDVRYGGDVWLEFFLCGLLPEHGTPNWPSQKCGERRRRRLEAATARSLSQVVRYVKEAPGRRWADWRASRTAHLRAAPPAGEGG